MTIDNKWFHIHNVSDRENISSIISRKETWIDFTSSMDEKLQPLKCVMKLRIHSLHVDVL